MGLRNAERALITVNHAVGPLRERLAAIAAELTTAEKEAERLEGAASEMDGLQQSIDRWLSDVRGLSAPEVLPSDIDEKLKAFTD